MRDVQPITTEPGERWRVIAGWPDYAVSDRGRVQRLTTYGRGIAGTIRKHVFVEGYAAVTLTNRDGRRQLRTVHSLVAEAFIGPRPAGMQVNHNDTNRRNPRLDNLEYTTPSGNIQHGYDHGDISAKGERNGYSKLTEAAVRDIRAASAPRSALAAKHGVSPATINDVRMGRTWSHIT